MEEFDAVLGTRAKQREEKYQFENFSEKLKQYVLQKLRNPKDIIILVRT